MIEQCEYDRLTERSPAYPEPQLIRITPSGDWGLASLVELWRHRELLYFLTWRAIKVRYKQTAIGAAWVVLQPLLTMVVFSVIFGQLIGVSSDNAPYPVFAFAALLPWTLFATAFNRVSGSLLSDSHLLSKVYFPRLLLPLSAVLSAVFDFAVAFCVLVAMMLFYGITPGLAVLALPIFLLLALATALGCGLWLAALNVKYRDIGYALPYLTQFWLLITPVAYSSSLVPERWRTLYGLNPMCGVVEGFRWALLGAQRAPSVLIFISTAVVAGVLIGGLLYFRKREDEFADVV
jgi:lipopolysaccharide transport system permease protein